MAQVQVKAGGAPGVGPVGSPNGPQTARMFKSDFLEMFSKVHPITPMVVFIPIISWMIYRGVTPQLPWFMLLACVAGGFFLWTFTEYTLHRFVFHAHLPGKLGARIHFLAHGVHHDYPRDANRLVMPPAVSLPLAVAFYYLFRAIVGEPLASPLFAGFAQGYLVYDMMHFALHHFNWNNKWFRNLKQHHMRHHFMDGDRGYGVSSAVWDYVFGTQRFRTKAEQKQQQQQAPTAG